MNRATAGWAAIGLILMLGPATAADRDETALESLIDAFLAAASVNDAAMHERFWSDDLIYTSSSGERFGKRQILEGLASAGPATVTPAYHAEDMTVQRHDDFAVMTFRLVAVAADKERTEYFNTGVFRRENDQWRAFVWQATRASLPDDV
jgi:ketosteroid isomerase-like protein